MNPKEPIPGQEEYLYTRIRDMKCCLHACSVWDCPEAVCLQDFPAKGGFRGGLTAYRRYQETLKVYRECQDIKKAAELLGVDPSNVRKRFKWLESIIK